jgi:hypothetical protein
MIVIVKNEDLSIGEADNPILHAKFVIKICINIVIEKH